MIDILVSRFGVEEAAAEAEGIAALGFDPKAFIIQLITALIVIYILQRYVFGRVVKMLETRRETIEEGVRLTTEMVAERDKLEKEVDKTLAEARKEAEEIVSRTHEQASVMIKEAEELAGHKVDSMLVDARKKIEDETAKARRKLEGEVIELVIQATEIVASEKLDAKKDAALISRALKGQV